MAHNIAWPPSHQLLTEQAITQAIAQQAQHINQTLGNTPLLALCILHGGMVYSGHLLPQLKMPVELDALRITRYRNTTTGGDKMHWINQPELSLKDKNILLIFSACI